METVPVVIDSHVRETARQQATLPVSRWLGLLVVAFLSLPACSSADRTKDLDIAKITCTPMSPEVVSVLESGLRPGVALDSGIGAASAPDSNGVVVAALTDGRPAIWWIPDAVAIRIVPESGVSPDVAPSDAADAPQIADVYAANPVAESVSVWRKIGESTHDPTMSRDNALVALGCAQANE